MYVILFVAVALQAMVNQQCSESLRSLPLHSAMSLETRELGISGPQRMIRLFFSAKQTLMIPIDVSQRRYTPAATYHAATNDCFCKFLRNKRGKGKGNAIRNSQFGRIKTVEFEIIT